MTQHGLRAVGLRRRTRRAARPSARARQNCVLWMFRSWGKLRRAPLAMSHRAAVAAMSYDRSFDGCGGLPRRARAKDLRCCSVFGAAQRDPLLAVDAEVAATAFRRGRSPPDAAARRGCRRVAFDREDTEHNNLELERHRINRPQEPYIRFNCVVAPRIQTHLIEIRLVARRLRFIQIILKIRRHSE